MSTGVLGAWTADGEALHHAGLRARRPSGRSPALRTALSDPHDGGRTVALVTTDDGSALVYKPRSLAVDAAFARLLGWLASAAPELLPLRAVRTLDRGTHGWAEYVRPAPCADAAALARYYERAGALLAVAYALRLGDLHAENVVAAGEHPLLIDLEAALSPVLHRPRPRGDADRTSVLDTCLLPIVHLDAGGRGFVASGIAPRPACADDPGDAAPGRPGAHVPTCPAPVPELDPDAVGALVARGFDRSYRALVRHRRALLAADGPLAAFRPTASRVVVRATAVYGAMLRRLAHPYFATRPAEREAELGRLHAPFRDRPEWARMAGAFAAERRALSRGDVPRFEVRATGTALRADGRVVVPAYAGLSGLEAVRRRVRALGDRDRRRQLACIRLAFAAEAHRATLDARATADRRGDALDAAAPEPLRPADALAEARRVGALLARLAAYGRDGDVARWWTGEPRPGAPPPAPMGPGLAHGQAGVALALAELASVDPGAPAARDRPAWDALARAALAPVRRALERARAGRTTWATLGGDVDRGRGGIALACLAVAQRLGDDALLDVARLAVAGVDGRACGPADHAGLAAALLALHERTADPALLARAHAHARRLEPWLHERSHDRSAARGTASARGGRRRTQDARRAVIVLGVALHADDAHLARHAASALTALVAPTAAQTRVRTLAAALAAVQAAAPDARATAALAPATLATWRDLLTAAAAVLVPDADAGTIRPREPYGLVDGTLARVTRLRALAATLDEPAYDAAARRLARALVSHAHRRLAYHALPTFEPFATALAGGLAGVVCALASLARPGDTAPAWGVLAGGPPPR